MFIKNKHLLFDLAISFLLVILTTTAMGANHRNYLLTIVVYFVGFVIAAGYKRVKYWLLVPLLIICWLYLPVGMIYGSPNIGSVASLFDTNKQEAWEFITNLPSDVIPWSVSLFVLIVIFSFKKTSYQLKHDIPLLIAVALLYFSPYHHFFVRGYKSVTDYFVQEQALEAAFSHKVNVDIEQVSPKYQNYVLVIGESMRRDYMSLYGYPTQTTPYLDKANGLFVNGYISTAPNTTTSLPRTLSLSQGMTFEPNINLINLANSAGFKTYWLSNQGKMGRYDTPISKFAILSNETHFLKNGSFNGSINYQDSDLLPVFKQALSEKTPEHKLIVVHLMGSHAKFCRRIKRDQFNLKDKQLSCYLSTYREFDQLMKNMVEILNNSHQSYSLLYFSDHGLSDSHSKGQPVYLVHGPDHKSNYEVPFFILSSDSHEHKLLNKPVSAYHFLSLFSDWTGITSKKVTPLSIDQINDKNIKVFNYTKMVNFNDLAPDPAVKISS
ncbi:phosphoethanolamine transferase [Photobacterium leiognathi]|uniref:phosphoethanolamine transferase n=1 Tax=Photobacterium leiognathi TaxID=553611 RepID=UPI002980AD68|nr:phosphoethanolamine transferase [Photobacterium leiognathi]